MNWVDFKNINKDVFKSKGFLHLSFWVLSFFFLLLADRHQDPMWSKVVNHLIDITIYIVVVYINILYLIPQFLQKKKPLLYLICLVALAFLVTPIKTASYLLINQNSPEAQQYVLDHRNVIFLIYIFVCLASTLFKVTSDWLTHHNEKNELESQKLQSELKFLKSQINPHFFFNTLNNLYALTLKKSDLAPEIVLRLSEMMRYMLYESNEKRVSLEKEVNYVKNYLELEKLRQGNKFDIKFKLQGITTNKQIAPLMFIPFLENSFKHGLDNQIKSGFVNIELNLHENSVELDITNSKTPSIPTKQKGKKSGGIGLENVKRRLKLLYPQKHVLEIEDKPNTFKVFLNIQLN